MSRRQRQETLWAYFFTAPYLVGLLVLSAGPLLAVGLFSLCDYNMRSPPRWNGFANYSLLMADPDFWKSVRNTFAFVLGSVPAGIVLALALALLLNRQLRGIKLFRALFFLPVVSSVVAVALVWNWIYDRDRGLLNLALGWFLGLFGIHVQLPGWIAGDSTAMLAIVVMSIWKGLGYNIMIFLAGLQEVPDHLLEAAEIDGAGPWQRFRHVTLPMLSPTLFFVTVISLIGAFQVFEQPYVMRSPDLNFTVHTVVWYIFEKAFKVGEMGYAATMGIALALLLLALTLLQLSLQRRWVHYGR
jgi:multiple sugar transport system permease protein